MMLVIIIILDYAGDDDGANSFSSQLNHILKTSGISFFSHILPYTFAGQAIMHGLPLTR